MWLRVEIDPWVAIGDKLVAYNLPGVLAVSAGPLGADAYPAHRALEVRATDGSFVRVSLDERETINLVRDLLADPTPPEMIDWKSRRYLCPACGYLGTVTKHVSADGRTDRECCECRHVWQIPVQVEQLAVLARALARDRSKK